LVQRFADTSLFDVKTPESLWVSLLSREKGITIIPSVRRELEPWLRAHPDHPAAQAVLLRDSAIENREYDTWGAEEAAVFEYYVWLLALRKRMFLMVVSRFREQHSREPTPAEFEILKQQIQKDYGPRGYFLAKKGAEAVGSFTDETLVYTGIASALRSGNPVHILTKDEDIQEQFWKMVWLLDTHYRGMLLAKAYAADSSRFEVLPMPMDHPAFNGSFKSPDGLVIRRSDGLAEVLPPTCSPVQIRCSIVGQRLTEITFTAEREMAELLTVKGKTGGLNTDLFNGRNCQAYLAPMKIPIPFRDCAALAQEYRFPLPDSAAEISVLDFNQVIFCGERFATLV
jgi:hypothetical protein